MPEVDAIPIQCPSCERRFRVKKSAVEHRVRPAVKCPSCGSPIPIPSFEPDAATPRRKVTEMGIPGVGQASQDSELRDLLRQARRKKQSRSEEHEIAKVRRPPPSAPDTRPDAVIGDSTEPDAQATMPVGRLAQRASDLGIDPREAVSPPPAQPAPPPRPRMDTPRAGARMAVVQRHEPDEPTYTGPVPGRTPKVTPTEKDLARFLVPGNYQVRVEDIVYAPVPHESVADLVDAGVMLGVTEIAAEDGVWTVIVAGGPLGGLRGRLSHRAHHLLARVAMGRPAEEFGRPPISTLLEGSDAAVATAAVPASQSSEYAGPGYPAAPGAALGAHGPVPRQVDPTEAMIALASAKPGKKKPLRIALIGLLLIPAVGAATLALAPEKVHTVMVHLGIEEEVVEAPVVVPEPVHTTGTVAAIEPPPPPDPKPAFQSARAAVISAAVLSDTIDGLLVTAREEDEPKLVTTLEWMKWLRSPEGVDSRALVTQLMKRGDYQEARQVANWLIATKGKDEQLETIVSDSVKKQFEEESVIEITPKRFTRFTRVETGHRPSLVLEDTDAQRWTFRPDLGQDGWRGDIAVYRLCQLMVCHFAVPETRAATIDKKAWRAILKEASPEVTEMAKKLYSDFDWSKKGVLTGSLRRLPGGSPWPIEATGIWRPWLTAGTGTTKLADPAESAHHEVAFFGAEKAIAELEGVTSRELGRQVADVLLVDYLVGNWNRFAANAEDWGSRTYIVDGLVFSVNDSAAFLSEDSVRVRGRFSWASRFSRTTIDSLRNLDPEEVEPLLFPDPSKAEQEKLKALWSQRKKALRRIDQLVKKYGADDVFALDAPNTPTNQ